MKVVLMTREYPPEVYGGAGVHVEYLSRELARSIEVEVRCFGAARQAPAGAPAVRAFQPWAELAGDAPHSSVLQVMSADLAMVADVRDASLVHSHTWYANLAGHLAKLMYGVPHVATTHSLEPLRPWKAEQTGTSGYALSSFCERTGLEEADAVISVSEAMREDILKCYPNVDPDRVQVIHNGIDPEEYRPDPGTDVLERYGVDPGRPSVVFVGRITRQKGITHLLDAVHHLDGEAQLVLCAGAPDTEEIGRETARKVDLLRDLRGAGNVVWLDRMLPKPEVIQLLSHATVFCCPSIYEPLGIVNLEAMACEAAVVATRTGGIPEVVEDGVTGWLVPFEPRDSAGTPSDPERFARDLAERLNALVGDPATAERFGREGRSRVLERFTWSGVAERTMALYRQLVSA
jgi:starch synthase